MVNIDTVYQKVLAIANKEQRGYITPQEFNLFADQAQMEIFEQYFYDINQLKRVPGNSQEYSDITHNLNEKIAFFESVSKFQAVGTPPVFTFQADDLYRLGTVIHRHGDNDFDVEVQEVQQNESIYINQSPLAKPTLRRPTYVRTSELTIDFFPASFVVINNSLTATYVRKPIKPSWGYFIIGDKALYDSQKAINFELHASEESELINKILRLAGISLKNPELIQSAQGAEIMQVQQEKK